MFFGTKNKFFPWKVIEPEPPRPFHPPYHHFKSPYLRPCQFWSPLSWSTRDVFTRSLDVNRWMVLQVPWPTIRWPYRRRTSPSTTGSWTTYSGGSTRYWGKTMIRSTCGCKHPHTPITRKKAPRKNQRTRTKSSPEKGNGACESLKISVTFSKEN